MLYIFPSYAIHTYSHSPLALDLQVTTVNSKGLCSLWFETQSFSTVTGQYHIRHDLSHSRHVFSVRQSFRRRLCTSCYQYHHRTVQRPKSPQRQARARNRSGAHQKEHRRSPGIPMCAHHRGSLAHAHTCTPRKCVGSQSHAAKGRSRATAPAHQVDRSRSVYLSLPSPNPIHIILG